MQVVDPIPQGFLQHGVLFRTRAVAGEIPGGEGSQLVQGVGQVMAGRVHADEVEAAEEHIRTEPVENIQHALVGTAAEAEFLILFLDQQILFMQIGVIPVGSVFSDGLAENAELEGPQQVVAGAEGDAFGNFQHILHGNQPGIFFQFRVQANVFAAAEILPEGVAAQVHRGVVIDLQEPLQAAAVVIVAVGQNAEIHRVQINAHFCGIVGKDTGLARVKENGMGPGFDEKTQAVLKGQVLPEGGIFNECRDFHGITLNQNSVAVVHFVLDDLGGPAGEGLDPGL